MKCKICSNNLREKKLSEIDDFYKEDDKYYSCPFCGTEYIPFGDDIKILKKGALAKSKTKANILAVIAYIIFAILLLFIDLSVKSTFLSVIILSILIPSFAPVGYFVYRITLGKSNSRRIIGISLSDCFGYSLTGSGVICAVILLIVILPLSSSSDKIEKTEVVSENLNLVPYSYDNGTRYYFKHQEDRDGKYYAINYIDNDGTKQYKNIHDKDIKDIQDSTEPSVSVTKEVYYGSKSYPKFAELLLFYESGERVLEQKIISYDIKASKDMIIETTQAK